MENDGLDIILQSRLDQETSAIQTLKKDVTGLETKLKDTPIRLQVELDSDTLTKLQKQFAEIQAEVMKLKKSGGFTEMEVGLKKSATSATQVGEALKSVKKEAKLVSESMKFDLINDKHLQDIRMYQDSLLKLRKETTTFSTDDEGNKTISTQTEEVKSDYLKIQKDLYSEIKGLNNEIFAIEKQMVSASEEQRQKLEDQKSTRQEMITSINDTLSTHGLVNAEREKELSLAREIKDIQLEISQDKNTGSDSKKAYADLSKTMNEIFDIEKQMVTATGSQNAELEEQKIYREAIANEIYGNIEEQGLVNLAMEQELALTKELQAVKLKISSDKEIDKSSSQAYTEIKNLATQVFNIEKQILKANEDQRVELSKEKELREKKISDKQAEIVANGLINASREEELAISKQLRDVQLKIAGEKGVDAQSKQAYSELNKLAREESKIKRDMLKADGEHLELLVSKLAIVKQGQEALEMQTGKGLELHNEERHNELYQTRIKLAKDLQIEEQKLADKESIRIEKLNDKVSDVDFKQVDFYDDQAIKDYVIGLQNAGEEVIKFERKIDSMGRRQIEMTTTTELNKNKVKELKLVLDETSQSLHKQGEAIKPTSNRLLSYVQQMRTAIEKSIQWAVSMQLLYGSLRKIKEGIQIVADLDKELTQVAIVTGMTREETKLLALEYATLGKEMGKTVAEISKVNTELVRQGLETSESMERMEVILKLSASGAMEANEALTVVTSSVNALGENAEKTADILLKAGNISASSASGIGEALTKTASSARATGMSIEELSALISTLVEVTQESPSSLGNSLKALLARFNKVNEETGELNEELNDVHKAFTSVGIAFTDSEGQIRPVYELLSELNGIWGDLDKNTQMFIATSSAGARHFNRFIGIMDNFNRVQSINGELMEAGGTLNQNYATYLDSVEASANRAQASFEEMAIQTLNSDMIKTYYDMGTAIAEAITKVGAFNVALMALSGVFLFSNERYMDFSRKISKDIFLKARIGAIDFKNAVKHSDIQFKLFGSTVKSTGERIGLLPTLLNMAKAGFHGIDFAAMRATIAIGVLQATITMGLSVAITAVVGAMAKWWGAKKEATRQANELAEAVKGNVKGLRDNVKALSELKDEYNDLNEKLGKNKDMTKLTAEEQDRYNSIVEQLVRIAPEIVTGYNDKEQAVIDYTTSMDDLIAKEKELIRLENSRLLNKKGTIIKDSNDEIKDLNKDLAEVERKMRIFAEVERDGVKKWGNTDEHREKKWYDSRDTQERRVVMFELENSRKVLLNDIDSQLDKQRDLLGVYYGEIDAIESVSDGLKQMAKDTAEATLKSEGYEEAEKQVVSFQLAFEKMSDMVKWDNFSDENLTYVRDILLELEIAVDDVDDIMYEFAHVVDVADVAVEKLTVTVSASSEEFDELRGKVSSLTKDFKKLASGKELTPDELFKYIDEYEEIAEYIAETGDLSLKQGEMLNDLTKTAIKLVLEEYLATEKSSAKTLAIKKEELKIAKERLAHMEEFTGKTSDGYKKQQEAVQRLNREVRESSKEYDIASQKLKAMNEVSTQGFESSQIENYAEAFASATSKLDAYSDILTEIDEKGKLSGETNRKIMSDHTELIRLIGKEGDMRLFIMSLIDEQRAKQLDAHKQALMSTNDFTQKVYNANKTLFDDIAKIYGIDLENFKSLQRLKIEMANQSGIAISQSNRNTQMSYSNGDTGRLQTQLMDYQQALAVADNPNAILYEAIMSRVTTTDKGELQDLIRKTEMAISANKVIDEASVEEYSPVSADFSKTIPTKTKKPKGSKQHMDSIELLTDRYLKFKKAIEDVERSLESNNKIMEYVTGKDRITLLDKEIELLNEKQKLNKLLSVETRKEQDEVVKRLSKTIGLGDGTMGADNFNAYTKATEKAINGIISQINKTSNDSVRDSLTKNKDSMQKAYDKVKADFDRYMELQTEIPQLDSGWWDLEFDKFEKTLEILNTNLEKYAKNIDHVNDRLALMVKVREDNAEEVAKEYRLLNDISKIYEDSLVDTQEELRQTADLIAKYEKKIAGLKDKSSDEYKQASYNLTLEKNKREELFEHQRAGVTAFANHQSTLIDKHLSQLERAKQKIIDGLRELRVEVDSFDNNSFENSIAKILADLDKIDEVFMSGAEYNLSTSGARKDTEELRRQVTGTLEEIKELQSKATTISNRESKTDEDIEKRQKDLTALIGKQIEKENELKEIEKELRDEVEKTAIEHQKIEDSLENKIKLKEEELRKLQDQYDAEDKIKRMLEKQLQLMGAMDDSRYSYITGLGEEIFTYDQSKVADLQREIANMVKEDEREKALKKLQDEISQMQEDLETTRKINKEQLDVADLSLKSLNRIIGLLGGNIEENLGDKGLGNIYKEMGDSFIDGIKEGLKPLIDKFDAVWEKVWNKSAIDPTEEKRDIDDKKLGAKDKPKDKPKEVPKEDKGKSPHSYKAKYGETLSDVARKFSTTVDEILKLNPQIKNPDSLKNEGALKIPQFDTGGMTGSFGTEGRLAILHEKELVLNKSDTENILNTVDLARNMTKGLPEIENVTNSNSISNNKDESKSMVMNNPVFQGIKDMRSFSNEMQNMFRKGMPGMS